MALIPLRNIKREVVGHAVVDASDERAVIAFGPWHPTGTGYAATTKKVDGKQLQVRMHRFLLGLVPGDGLEGDHINHDRLDNRRSNLRILNRQENSQNHPGRGGSSPFRGVSWSRKDGRWYAYARVDGSMKNLGLHESELEAADTARRFRLAHMAGAVD